MTGDRIQGLAQQVYRPQRAKSYDEALGLIEDWEIKLERFQETENNKLSEMTKVYALRQIVPDNIDKDIG